MTAFAEFLASISSVVFRVAAVAFLIVNLSAILLFALSRSKRLVDSWTPRIVTLDAVLLGAAIGVPLLAGAARLAAGALAGLGNGVMALFK